MNVSGPLRGLPPVSPIPSGGPTRTEAAGADFGAALQQAVGALGQLGQQADASAIRLAAGEPIDIHEVMLNTEQASLGFSMALQVRNKIVEAYQEIMRMSV
ncbi:MAG: flagellar hook-basal body complex protein FliE [Chloroflexota bacterium]|nr:flagellar hook-basal body complex protein FliE [Chloroflexota bacterium]